MRTLVIFDIDGTLLDSVKAHQGAFESTLAQFDLNPHLEDGAAYRHHTDSWIFAEIRLAHGLRFPSSGEIAEFDDQLAKNFAASVSAGQSLEMAGAIRLLAALDAQPDFATAYATGGMKKITDVKLQNLGFRIDPELVVTATDHTTREHIVLEAIARSDQGQTDSARVVAIGDGVWDAKAARSLKIGFVGVGEHSQFHDTCLEDEVVPSLEALTLESLRRAGNVVQLSNRTIRPVGQAECACWSQSASSASPW
jgi:phosphoglycolate phosphatase-like HAD superfamily hydrolase